MAGRHLDHWHCRFGRCVALAVLIGCKACGAPPPTQRCRDHVQKASSVDPARDVRTPLQGKPDVCHLVVSRKRREFVQGHPNMYWPCQIFGYDSRNAVSRIILIASHQFE